MDSGYFRKECFMKFLLLCSYGLIYCAATSGYAQANDSNIPSHPCFKVYKIGKGIWRIVDNDIVNMYLVEGRDSALLIDNGLGAANLRDFIKSITKLPLIVVITHAHPDHSGANYQFPQVYASPDDFEAVKFFTTPEMRAGTLQAMIRNPVLDSLKFKDTVNQQGTVLLPAKNGYVFDLGNRTLEVIQVQGHTKGSICLLDNKENFLFTGDNNNMLVWLHTPAALPLETYLKSLKKLESRAIEFNTLLPGHGDPIEKEFIKDQIGCVENILTGKCKGTIYKTFAGDGLLCGYKRAQVAYNPNNLHDK
jgi:hydroxyacylglutathione hydrolase